MTRPAPFPRALHSPVAPWHADVADAMHEGVFTCPRETGLAAVARLMAMHQIHAVVVTGLGGDPARWGVISDLDLVAAAVGAGVETEAGEVAATGLPTVTPRDSLEEAARRMREHRVAHLLVVSAETGAPVGIVSTLDVAESLAWGRA